MKKYKKEPDPHKPLTKKEWDAMGPVMHGINELPAGIRDAIKSGFGRPKAEHTKAQVTLRLDDDILEKFRATGAGWQTRINAALREYWA